MPNSFADGLARFGENIPLVNNGIQAIHRRNGNEEALHRARHTNPIGAHGAITRAVEYVPGVNNVVQAAHKISGQPEALSRARTANPVGANGAVTQVAERVPGVSSVVQSLHEFSGQEEALQRAADRDPLASQIMSKEAEGLFELRHTSAATLAFEHRVMANGVQCWTDRDDAVFADVPDEIVGATLFAGRLISSLPASGTFALSIGCPARVYLLAEHGARSGGFSSLGWLRLPEADRMHVTLNGGTFFSAWSKDFEDNGTLEIPVQEPWVGCIAVRVLLDKGISAAESAEVGAANPIGKAGNAARSSTDAPRTCSRTVGSAGAVAVELTQAASRAQERGEHLEDMRDQSQQLAGSSMNFLEQARALNKKCGGQQPTTRANTQPADQTAAQAGDRRLR